MSNEHLPVFWGRGNILTNLYTDDIVKLLSVPSHALDSTKYKISSFMSILCSIPSMGTLIGYYLIYLGSSSGIT